VVYYHFVSKLYSTESELLQVIEYRGRVITGYIVQRASYYRLYSTESELLQVIDYRGRVVTG